MIYLVGTPIGNLEDITLRAIKTLQSADVIACESKERALKLLSHLGLSKPLTYLREQSRQADTQRIITLHREGKTVAVITDAGMPGISDPGAYLVKTLLEQGIPFQVVPGPSALDVAVSMSGLDEPWAFLGFLPLREGRRRRLLEQFLSLNVGLVIYEGPHRIGKLLSMLGELCPRRRVALLRELTKMHEQMLIGLPSQLLKADYRGEFVVVVYPEE
ncbi:16S rRNA (cytidine(1402)-2'-O)-methyltransferase [Coprothermobacteraceae bacterium]|nr:16S rRNA (cytidine(1402)-2'-O)-methyltransferase [Coprothermobacteraceae bacterium]